MIVGFARYLKGLARRILLPPPTWEVQEWSIGIYAGAAPWQVMQPEHVVNPVLTNRDVSDTKATFVADPFMLRVEATWYMFFEVMNSISGKGEIALATSGDGYAWHYEKIVLAEPFHLSYPYVFAWSGDYYMIPESWEAGEVRLYRAAHFPAEWILVATLIRGSYLADSSIFHAGDHWWMFVENGENFSFDTLRLYFAPALTGPWVEHPRSPIVSGNPHIARPAGRVLVDGDRIIRFAQDCSPKYGLRVFAFEIVELTPELYEERPLVSGDILGGTGAGWNSDGMHHIDAHRLDHERWIACVDGWRSLTVQH
jgi:hypothetical protein